MMDISNIKYRIRQCSNCPDGLEYICETCSCVLCLPCKHEHMLLMAGTGTIHSMINYRQKFKNLKNPGICLKHSNSVYDTFCEQCITPICSECTEHRTHKTTDLRRAYEKNLRQNKRLIQTIEEKELFCYSLLSESEIDFRIVAEEVANMKSKLQAVSKELTGYIDNVRYRFPAKFRCLKQKTKMNRCISSVQIFEHVYEHSSMAPIKFLLSVKKKHNFKMENRAFLKQHGLATVKESPNFDNISKKLLTINISGEEKLMQFTKSDMGLFEKIKSRGIRRLKNAYKSPESMSNLMKWLSMNILEYPMLLQLAVEFETPLVPFGASPRYLQGKRHFKLPELLSTMKEEADEIFKRKISVGWKHLSIPNMHISFDES